MVLLLWAVGVAPVHCEGWASRHFDNSAQIETVSVWKTQKDTRTFAYLSIHISIYISIELSSIHLYIYCAVNMNFQLYQKWLNNRRCVTQFNIDDIVAKDWMKTK